MALIKCPACGTEISDAAPACVKCGHPARFSQRVSDAPTIAGMTTMARRDRISPGAGCILLSMGILVLAAVFHWVSKDEPRRSEPSPTAAPTPALAAKNEPGPDAAARKKILSQLKAKHDKFQEVTFYQHPNTPILGTQVYFYIVEQRDTYALRLVAQYEGDDWVFWDKLVFRIDGQIATLDARGLEVRRNNSGGTVWETLDQPALGGVVGGDQLQVTEMIGPIAAGLMKASSVSMRFDGRARIKDRDMPRSEMDRLKKVGRVYFALFGMVDKSPSSFPPDLQRP